MNHDIENSPTLQFWAEQYNPIPNPFSFHTGFDYGYGSTLFYLVDLQTYCQQYPVTPDRQWTLIENPETNERYIAQGAFWVNAAGYFITERAPFISLTEDIPLEA
jgi:hypothetical protein